MPVRASVANLRQGCYTPHTSHAKCLIFGVVTVVVYVRLSAQGGKEGLLLVRFRRHKDHGDYDEDPPDEL